MFPPIEKLHAPVSAYGRGMYYSRQIDRLLQLHEHDGVTNMRGKEYVQRFNEYSERAAHLTVMIWVIAVSLEKEERGRLMQLAISLSKQRKKMKAVKYVCKMNPVPREWAACLDHTLKQLDERLHYVEKTKVEENLKLLECYPYFVWLGERGISIADDMCAVLQTDVLEHCSDTDISLYAEAIKAAEIPAGVREKAEAEMAEARRIKENNDKAAAAVKAREAEEAKRKLVDQLDQELMCYLSKAAKSKRGNPRGFVVRKYMACAYALGKQGAKPRCGFLSPQGNITKDEKRAAIGGKEYINTVVARFKARDCGTGRVEMQKVETLPEYGC